MSKQEVANSSQLILTDIGSDTKSIQTESLCINCLEQGVTTILLTKIPFFRDIMVSRFECPHCQYVEKSVQFSGGNPDQGVHYELHVQSPKDLNRRVVKSSECTIYVKQINLEIPGQTHGNSISTVEGILEQCSDDLKNVKQTAKIVEFLSSLEQCQKGLMNFDFVLDDPSGNSFIENPNAPEKDPYLDVTFYTPKRKPKRTESPSISQNESFYCDEDTMQYVKTVLENNEVIKVPITCPVCEVETFISTCTLKIPDFKEIEIKVFICESCGYSNGQIYFKGPTSPTARTITLHSNSIDDQNRQILRAESASIEFPEIDLRFGPGMIGGKFTTVGGLLAIILKILRDDNPFTKKNPSLSPKFDLIIEKLSKFLAGEEKFTIVLRDPLSNSYIQKFYGDDENTLKVVDGERTEEENEELGLNEAANTGDGGHFTGNPTFNSVLRALNSESNCNSNEKEKKPE